jgi:hypothetical protein
MNSTNTFQNMHLTALYNNWGQNLSFFLQVEISLDPERRIQEVQGGA